MLTNGLYPNVAYHTDARKLLTAEGKFALIHKGSVNCNKENKPIFPFYAFTEKIRTQTISCKSLTMISPVHLLLFGCRKAVWTQKVSNSLKPDEGVIMLDDWLPVRIRYSTAARLFALRPALDALLVKICQDPTFLQAPGPKDTNLIELTKSLCTRTAIPGIGLVKNQCLSSDDVYPDIYRTKGEGANEYTQYRSSPGRRPMEFDSRPSVRGPVYRDDRYYSYQQQPQPQHRQWGSYGPPQPPVHAGAKRRYPSMSQREEGSNVQYNRQPSSSWGSRVYHGTGVSEPPPLVPINRGPVPPTTNQQSEYYQQPPMNYGPPPLQQGGVSFPPRNPPPRAWMPQPQSGGPNYQQGGWNRMPQPPYNRY